MQKLLATVRARIGSYEIIAFVSGFVLMAYEMVASRLLAPSIGSSMYVWTSVIGVMIAALAVGYATGGWLADKRVAVQDIAWLLLASAIAMLGTLLFYGPILSFVASNVADQRAQGILAATLLFLPASFGLGMLSPYLARLRVRSVTTTGRSVAGLSALNSIGGISGTFFAGFIFFSLIGSRETLTLLIGVLVLCSWLVVPRHRIRWRTAVSACMALLLVMQFASGAQAAGVVRSIDTPTARYDIVDSSYRGKPARLLVTGPRSYQSGIYKDGSKALVFDYTQRMAQAVALAPHKDAIVIIGGGAFTLPEYLAKAYPRSTIIVVEIDPQLEQIAKDYFEYQPQPNIKVIAQDARVFLHQSASAQYDVVLVDAYGHDTTIPFALATRQYASELKNALKPDGVVIANIIGATSRVCMPALASLHGSYESLFASAAIMPVTHLPGYIRQNYLAIYSQQPLQWTETLGAPAVLDMGTARPITDNYAPIETLWRQCAVD